MRDLCASLIKALPHAYPFLMIDRIIEFEEGKRIVCLKNVCSNEEFSQGYFDGNPFMPEVLIIEAMAQASGLIMRGGNPEKAYLGEIKNAIFTKSVVPGDRLMITSFLIHKLHPLYAFEVIATVGSEVVSQADITLACT